MVSTTDEVVSEVASVDVQAQATEIKSISEDDFEKAQKTFQLGKKNLFLNKYDEAVNNIGEACKIYSTKFGELDPQCAEIYFFYGRSLLELARVENTVLGNALNGVPEDTEPIDDSRYGNPEDINAEEKEEISEKVIDALCGTEEEANGTKNEEETKKTEENGTTEATPTTEKAEKIEEDVTAKATTEETKPAETAEEKKEEEAAAGEEEGEEEEDGEEETGEDGDDLTKQDGEGKDDTEAEDISNLQRSWEMFELAKLIYTKNFTEDATFKNKRTAECLLKLGEISIEQEVYEQAITDISESIKLQEEQTGEQRDERMLAESYYQLGLAQQFNNQFTEANESYQKSINIVQLRIEKLRGKLTTIGEGADADLEKNTINDEITELEALLPEMQAKLEEVNEQGQQSLNLIKEAKECFLNNIDTTKQNGAAAAAAPTNGEVKDITSLVKSKRKISASDEVCNGTKKTRLSEGNGEEIAEENKIEIDQPAAETAKAAAAEEIETNKENLPETAAATETSGATETAEKIAVDEEPAAAKTAENGIESEPAANPEPIATA